MEAGRRHTGPHLPRLPWSLTVERRGAPVHELDKFPGRCLHRLLAGPAAHGHLAEGALRFPGGLGPLIYLSFGNSPSQSPRSDRSKAQTSASAPFLTEGSRCRASSQPTNPQSTTTRAALPAQLVPDGAPPNPSFSPAPPSPAPSARPAGNPGQFPNSELAIGPLTLGRPVPSARSHPGTKALFSREHPTLVSRRPPFNNPRKVRSPGAGLSVSFRVGRNPHVSKRASELGPERAPGRVCDRSSCGASGGHLPAWPYAWA